MTTPKQCHACGRMYVNQEDFLKQTKRWRLGTDECLYFNCICGSTLVLPPGKYEWYDPELSLPEEHCSLFNELMAKKKLPHIPAVLPKLQMMLQDEKISNAQIAQTISFDPLLATSLLALANTWSLGRSGKITSLEHAISSIGRRGLSNLINIASIRTMKMKSKYYPIREVWKDSLISGTIARDLVGLLNHSTLILDEIVITTSLVSSLGRIVSLFFYWQEIDDALQKSDNLYLPWKQLEEETHLPEYEVLGEIAAAIWGLPEFIFVPMRGHLAPISRSNIREEDALLNNIAGLSLQIAWNVQNKPDYDTNLMLEFANAIHLSNEKVYDLVWKYYPKVEELSKVAISIYSM